MKESFRFSLHRVVKISARSIMSGLGHEAQERHGTVGKDNQNDKRSRKRDQKGLNELHLFPRRTLKGKHDESLQTCKKPLHKQVEKAVSPARGRYIRCKLQQGSFTLGIFLSF